MFFYYCFYCIRSVSQTISYMVLPQALLLFRTRSAYQLTTSASANPCYVENKPEGEPGRLPWRKTKYSIKLPSEGSGSPPATKHSQLVIHVSHHSTSRFHPEWKIWDGTKGVLEIAFIWTSKHLHRHDCLCVGKRIPLKSSQDLHIFV